MQSIEEIESLCYRNELDRAERYMNERYGDPTAKELYEACLHGGACLHTAKRKAPIYGAPWESLGCDDCDEWEDSFCPMRLAGTMRCVEDCERT